jgi:hypothetical protein
MAPCCGEDDGGSTARTQIMIILVILCVCVIIVIMLLCDYAGKEWLEINTFYQGFEGRKLLIKEKKLVYRSAMIKVRRYQNVK